MIRKPRCSVAVRLWLPLTGLILQFSWIAVSQADLHLTGQPGKDLALTGAGCQALDQQRASLLSWKKKIGEAVKKTKKADPACSCQAPDNCTLNIESALPSMVAELHSVKAQYQGPNCWNAALVSGKLLPYLRYSTESEFSFWLESPFCRERPPGEAPQPGDIGAIREFEGAEVHGFVYLTPELSFSKNGKHESQPYLLQGTQTVLNAYDVNPGCGQNRDTREGCNRTVQYYSCTAMDQPGVTEVEKLNSEMRAERQRLDYIECNLSLLAFHGKDRGFDRTGAESVAKAAGDALMAIQELALKEYRDTSNSERERFEWGALASRAYSSMDQLDQVWGLWDEAKAVWRNRFK
jgi:hypothetical protein